MRSLLIKTFIALLLTLPALPLLAKTDIVIDPDYDPRITLRVVVLPAQKDRSLKRVNERTVSAMFATELLRIYEVLDLLRFERTLEDQRIELADAFSADARETVRDIAGVDAIASIEVYRWQEGRGGIPFLTAKSGTIGMRVRLMDPYTGRVYWSVNRLDSVKPGMDFLDRSTELFRDLVSELKEELEDRAEEFSEADSYAELAAKREPWQRMQGYGRRTYTKEDGVERGFMPVISPEEAYLQARRGYGYQSPENEQTYEAPVNPDVAYEDIEQQRSDVLPELESEPLYGEDLKAAVDSLLRWAGADTNRDSVKTPPELPAVELEEVSEDTTSSAD